MLTHKIIRRYISSRNEEKWEIEGWGLVKSIEFTKDDECMGDKIYITINDIPVPITYSALTKAWELFKEQLKEEAKHQRELEKKMADNRDSDKWLEILKDKEGEQSIDIDAPHGTKIKYQRGGTKKKASSKKKKDEGERDTE